MKNQRVFTAPTLNLTVLFLLFIPIHVFAQIPPHIQWQKCLGGTYHDEASCIQQTSDGGYIVAGDGRSNDGDETGHHGGNGSPDYWVVKLNSIGTIQWQKSLGGTGVDIAYSIQQTADGGYIIAGESNSSDGDVAGNVYASSGSAFWIVKLDATGNIQWQKCLGGSGTEIARSIEQTSDGGYVVAGNTTSNDGDVSGNHGSYEYWVVKLNMGGIVQWQKCLGGSGMESPECSIQQTPDHGYIFAGGTSSSDGDVTGYQGNGSHPDYWIVKLTTSGSIRWQKSLGGTEDDYAKSIKETTSGGYIIAGYTNSTNGDVVGKHLNGTDYWVVKLVWCNCQ